MSTHSLSLPFRRHRTLSSDGSRTPLEIPLNVADEELMLLVQRGNIEAFTQLFDRLYGFARFIARKLLKNPEDVADVVQESFLDMHQNANTFDRSKGSLKGWVSCIVYRRALKRSLLLKRQIFETTDIETMVDILPAIDGSGQWIQSLDFRRCLNTALGMLNEKQRQTMILYFFEGHTLSDISDQLQESLGNTRHHLYRGLKKLRFTLVQSGLLEGYLQFESKQERTNGSGQR